MDLQRADETGPLALSPRVLSTALEFTCAKSAVRHLLLPVFALAAAALLSREVPVRPLAVWVGANLACAIGWAILHHFVLARGTRSQSDLLRRIALFGFFNIITAATWASVAVFGWVPGSDENNYFILMMLIGDISTMLFSLSPIIALVVPGVLPPFIAMVIVPLANGMNDGGPIVGVSALYVGVLVCVVVIMRQKSLESFRLREERADLVAALSEELTKVEGERDEAMRDSQSTADFVIRVAHDLRTPLNSILGFADVIRDEILGPLGPSPYRRIGNDIHTSGSELLRLIEYMQQVLKIEAGQVELAPERLRADLLIARAIRAARPRAEARRVRLASHVPATLPRLWADESAIETILDHLLCHAIACCREGGLVSISAGVAPEGGITMRVLASDGVAGRMFTDDDTNGTSDAGVRVQELWRPIAQGLVELHSGVLTLEQREDGATLLQVIFPPERTVALASIVTSDVAA